jgi:hypothetical protein
MKKYFKKTLTVGALFFATLNANAQVATRLQFPNQGQHVYFSSSVTEFNNYLIIGTEFRGRVHLFLNSTFRRSGNRI